MKRTSINIGIVFNTPLLGSSSGNPNIHAEFVASKAPSVGNAAEETKVLMEALTEEERKKLVEENVGKAMTVFPKDKTGLFLWDYQVRGFIKETVAALIELGDIDHLTKWAHKKAVDNFIHVSPRRIYLLDEHGKNIPKATGNLERPLRAETMQGERIALANSEMLPENTRAEFTVTVLQGTNNKTKVATLTPDDIKSCFEFGILKGFLQWRSGGFGRFDITRFDVTK